MYRCVDPVKIIFTPSANPFVGVALPKFGLNAFPWGPDTSANTVINVFAGTMPTLFQYPHAEPFTLVVMVAEGIPLFMEKLADATWFVY